MFVFLVTRQRVATSPQMGLALFFLHGASFLNFFFFFWERIDGQSAQPGRCCCVACDGPLFLIVPPFFIQITNERFLSASSFLLPTDRPTVCCLNEGSSSPIEKEEISIGYWRLGNWIIHLIIISIGKANNNNNRKKNRLLLLLFGAVACFS